MQRISIPTVFLVVPLVVAAVALAAIASFPEDALAWRLGFKCLPLTALALVAILPITAWSWIRDTTSRAWPRGIAFFAGIVYLVALAIGAWY